MQKYPIHNPKPLTINLILKPLTLNPIQTLILNPILLLSLTLTLSLCLLTGLWKDGIVSQILVLTALQLICLRHICLELEPATQTHTINIHTYYQRE